MSGVNQVSTMRLVLQSLVMNMAVLLVTSQFNEHVGKLCDSRPDLTVGFCVLRNECDVRTNTLKVDRELPPADVEPRSCPSPYICCFPKIGNKIFTSSPAEVFGWIVSFMVPLRKENDKYAMKFVKNGVMIRPKVVLTTATVIARVKKEMLTNYNNGIAYVVVGDTDQRVTESDRKAYLVQKMTAHKYYNKTTCENDTALAILKNAVTNVKLVTLPPPDFEFPNQTDCYFTGWGRDRNRKHQSQLMRTEMPALDEHTCSALGRYSGLGRYYNIPETLVCAGGIAYQEMCTARGGAPLVCDVGDDEFQLRGLQTYVPNCANDVSMVVFAKVSKFIDWIEENIDYTATS